MAIEIQSNFVDIRGAKIHYLDAGNLTSLPILFLHGASFNAQTWVLLSLSPRTDTGRSL